MAEISAKSVLQYLDYFAGQEDTAEQVRDFVQLAARFLDQNRSFDEWKAIPQFGHFIEWIESQY